MSAGPALTGAAATRARALVDGVAAALLPWPVRMDVPGSALEKGSAGIALFLAHASASRSPEVAAAARAHLDAAIETLSTMPMPASLFRGFTGIAMVSQQIWSVLNGEDGSEGGEDIDEMVLEMLEEPERISDHGLMDGLIGLGVYALARPIAERVAQLVVTRLGERAVRDPARPGRSWLSFDPIEPTKSYLSLGMAHGVDAIIAYLGMLCRLGMATPAVLGLLDDAVTWLLATRLDGDPMSTVPMIIAPGEPPQAARCAWCYGELPAAIALLTAARGAGKPAWAEEAVVLARTAAARAPELARVRDAGVCHGAAGLGHMFARLHAATGDESLRVAAVDWFTRAMDLHDPSHDVAGFPTWNPQAPDGPWIAEPGYLYGAAGVGLALMSASGVDAPGWDAPLLLGPLP